MSTSHSLKHVELDIKELEYISSTGLRIILKMAKQYGTENVVVTNANDTIMEVFETTGFTDVITLRS